MTCTVIFDFKLKKDCVEKFMTRLQEIIPGTRGFEGFVSINITQNQDDSACFAFVEKWDARENYENYIQWRMESGIWEELSVMFDGEPSMKFYNYFGV